MTGNDAAIFDNPDKPARRAIAGDDEYTVGRKKICETIDAEISVLSVRTVT
jgi:hypothetical protein